MSAESAATIKRYLANYRDEVDGVALYQLLAGAETDVHLKEVYTRLAASEERHLELWRERLRSVGAEIPEFRPSLRVKTLGWLARRFGTAMVSPIVTRMEMAATAMYDDQPEAVAANLPADERSHARLFREISRTSGRLDVDIARVEGRHRAGTGNALRAAVLGANDGLVSNLLLVVGVAGANPGRDVVLLAGLGGLIAGSISMALGEWISVRSSSEAFARQVAIEREELELMPEEEEEELFLIYRAKGLQEEEARVMAKRRSCLRSRSVVVSACQIAGRSCASVSSAARSSSVSATAVSRSAWAKACSSCATRAKASSPWKAKSSSNRARALRVGVLPKVSASSSAKA